jgi:hypothetical protein
MKALVFVFIENTPSFLAESCQGDGTQQPLSVLESTIQVHSVHRDICVATDTGGLMWAVVCN